MELSDNGTFFGSGEPPRILNRDRNTKSFSNKGYKWIDTNNQIQYIFDNKWNRQKSLNLNEIPELYNEKIGSLVLIYRFFVNFNDGNASSGFFVSSDGFIVTNFHVIFNRKNDFSYNFLPLYAQIFPENVTVPCVIVGYDAAMDVALLKIDLNDSSLETPLSPREFLTIENSREQKIGSFACTIGEPAIITDINFNQNFTTGILMNNKFIRNDLPESIVLDVKTGPGNSGGPILNLKGNLIGMLSFGVDSSLTNRINKITSGTSSYVINILMNHFITNFQNNGDTGQCYPAGFFGISYRYYTPAIDIFTRGGLLQNSNPTKIEGIIIETDDINALLLPDNPSGTGVQLEIPPIVSGSPAESIGLTGLDIITKIAKHGEELQTIGVLPDQASFMDIIHFSELPGMIDIEYLKKSESYSIIHTATGIVLEGYPPDLVLSQSNYFT